MEERKASHPIELSPHFVRAGELAAVLHVEGAALEAGDVFTLAEANGVDGTGHVLIAVVQVGFVEAERVIADRGSGVRRIVQLEALDLCEGDTRVAAIDTPERAGKRLRKPARQSA